ncbi:MAG: 50S ribosomal protein L10 [Oscillospiraceae bacterium]|nr:50S ribosomal protein L10 [Oscillospiraceae bacterium]
MPNAKVLSEKQAFVAALTERLQSAASGLFIDYQGITVAEDTALRNELRENNVEYTVIKNTLARFAVKNIGFDELDPILNGTTSLATSTEDPLTPMRIISKYAKALGDEKFTIKAGFMEGKILPLADVAALAALPSKDVLLAQVLGTMLAPITSLAIVIKAIAEKGGVPAEKAAEEAPAAEAPAEEAVAEPAAEAPAEEAPASEAVTEAPAEEAATDAPAEETPAE